MNGIGIKGFIEGLRELSISLKRIIFLLFLVFIFFLFFIGFETQAYTADSMPSVPDTVYRNNSFKPTVVDINTYNFKYSFANAQGFWEGNFNFPKLLYDEEVWFICWNPAINDVTAYVNKSDNPSTDYYITYIGNYGKYYFSNIPTGVQLGQDWQVWNHSESGWNMIETMQKNQEFGFGNYAICPYYIPNILFWAQGVNIDVYDRYDYVSGYASFIDNKRFKNFSDVSVADKAFSFKLNMGDFYSFTVNDNGFTYDTTLNLKLELINKEDYSVVYSSNNILTDKNVKIEDMSDYKELYIPVSCFGSYFNVPRSIYCYAYSYSYSTIC